MSLLPIRKFSTLQCPLAFADALTESNYFAALQRKCHFGVLFHVQTAIFLPWVFTKKSSEVNVNLPYNHKDQIKENVMNGSGGTAKNSCLRAKKLEA